MHSVETEQHGQYPFGGDLKNLAEIVAAPGVCGSVKATVGSLHKRSVRTCPVAGIKAMECGECTRRRDPVNRATSPGASLAASSGTGCAVEIPVGALNGRRDWGGTVGAAKGVQRG